MREARPSRLQVQTARQILALVRRERLPPGYHLTEEALASRFGISRTPIRAALAMLARNGFLTARRHQGYFLTRNYEQIDASLDLPASADEAIYMRIARDRVRDWVFLPYLNSKQEQQSSYEFRLTLEPSGLLLSSVKLDTAALERARR